MPELPEVETIRRGLESCLAGRRIIKVEVRAAKLFQGEPEKVLNQPITAIERRGKMLILGLGPRLALTVHLKMTGQLIWKAAGSQLEVVGGHPEEAYLQPLPHKHTHIIFDLDDGSHLYFNDLRKFGKMEVVSADQLASHAFLTKLGPEPLGEDFTEAYLSKTLRRRAKTPIKSLLLDQTAIAGIGNIYADESLFRAAILPDRPAGSLTRGEARNLREAIQETLELALKYGGSTSRDYLNAVGERGTFLKIANVYHREGLDCNRCNEGKIKRIKLGGRSTHFCPACQG